MKISNMIEMKNMRVKAFFELTIGKIKMYGWRLLQRSDGKYYIEPPDEKYKDRKTGQIKYSKTIEIFDTELKEMILKLAIAEFEILKQGV